LGPSHPSGAFILSLNKLSYLYAKKKKKKKKKAVSRLEVRSRRIRRSQSFHELKKFKSYGGEL
jgi:hypothetical protein